MSRTLRKEIKGTNGRAFIGATITVILQEGYVRLSNNDKVEDIWRHKIIVESHNRFYKETHHCTSEEDLEKEITKATHKFQQWCYNCILGSLDPDQYVLVKLGFTI